MWRHLLFTEASATQSAVPEADGCGDELSLGVTVRHAPPREKCPGRPPSPLVTPGKGFQAQRTGVWGGAQERGTEYMPQGSNDKLPGTNYRVLQRQGQSQPARETHRGVLSHRHTGPIQGGVEPQPRTEEAAAVVSA